MKKCKPKSFEESNGSEVTILQQVCCCRDRLQASYPDDFPSTEGSHEMSMGDDRL